jgi:uncharacterized membrane protein YdjX (TVP38/TMEM64 family)
VLLVRVTLPLMARTLVLVLIALLVPIIPFVVIGELPGERWLDAGGPEPVVFGLVGAALLAGDVLLPVPSSIVGVLLGGRLGFSLGALTIFGGLSVGHVAGYWLGRMWPRRWSSAAPAEPSFWALLLSRPVPVVAEALTFAAGAMDVSFTSFLRAVLPGNLAYALALAALGAALLPERAYFAALAILLVVSGGAMWCWRRWRQVA